MTARAPAAIEVVVCTYNNAAMLDEVLAALGRQRPVDGGRWGCLVVDNNCTDSTPAVVEKHQRLGLIPNLRRIREEEQGLTPARLRGVRSTDAPWVAYVDDDCVVEPDWVAEAVAFVDRHPAAGAFGGKVILDYEREPEPYVHTYAYSFAAQDHGTMERRVPFLAGAGLVVSRAALATCGWSDGPLVADRIGRQLVSGGDVEIVLRVASAGYELWYVPGMALHHRIPARRTSLGYLASINRGLGVSQSLADALVWEGAEDRWAPASGKKLLKELVPLARLIVSVVRGRSTAAEIPIQASFRVGRALGISRVLRMPSDRRRQLIGRARPVRRPGAGVEGRGVRTFKPWRIVHVSLGDALPDLPADPASDGVFVVFWQDHRPLGQLLVRAPLLPIPSRQLASVASRVVAPAIAFRTVKDGFAPPLPVPESKQPLVETAKLSQLLSLDRPLATLGERAHPPVQARQPVSVVVCTRNRPDDLETCLAALAALSPAPSEIIVVDNDPRSGQTRPVTDRHPSVRYTPEERPGLSAARNTGILAATGDIVAFTDDDVIVDAGWVGAICEAFEDGGVAAVTGLVLPAELETAAQYAFQTDVLGWGWGYRAVDFDRTFFDATKDVGVPAWRVGAGANMAFRREVFDRVGRFDERLGAGASGCSEDSELWYRLLADGHRCRYWPAAVVLHRHRADWDGLRRQMYSYMRGHVTALFVQFERYRHWGNIYRAFLALPWYLVTLGFHTSKRWFARLFYDPQDGAIAQPVVPQFLGAIAGYGYYLRHRGRPANAAVLERERAQVPVR